MLWTVIWSILGLCGGDGIITMPASAVTASFGPAVTFVYTFQSRPTRPLTAPTQAAVPVAFMDRCYRIVSLEDEADVGRREVRGGKRTHRLTPMLS